MFYSTSVFGAAGDVRGGETATMLVALVNVLATLLAVRLIELAGRKGMYGSSTRSL
jgi:hypothetical protein